MKENNLSNMETGYNLLEWDTDFFGYKVYRLTDNRFSEAKLKQVVSKIKKLGGKLIYFSSDTELTPDALESGLGEMRLVDKKTTYLKKTRFDLQLNPHISSYHEDEGETKKKLIELAIESGVYSRFNMDPKIGRKIYEKLYTIWILKSIKRNFAKEVFVHRRGNEVGGFVTLASKADRGDIGIIAVDNSERGKGIGKSLMTAAEDWFAKNRIDSVQVVTQGDNIPACRLYESCGFELETVKFFYHIWL